MSGCLKAFLIVVALALVAAVGLGILVVIGVGKASHDVARALTPNPGRPAGYHGPAYPGMLTQDHVAGGTGEVQDYGESVTATNLRRVPGLFGSSLCADVSITNRSQQTKDVGPIEWKLQDPNATVHTLGFAGTLQTGQLAPGGTARGTVCNPDTGQSGTFVLLWQPLQLRADRGVWLFNL
jgi:hypothetical protein